MIRLALVDDHDIIREGMKYLIMNDHEIEIVAEASSLHDVQVQHDVIKDCDVMVLDLFLQREIDGLQLLQEAQNFKKYPAIVVVSMFSKPELIQRCLNYGAKGYIPKGDAGKYLVRAIHEIALGKTYVSPTVESIKPEEEKKIQSNVHLTKREHAIFDLLGKGLTTRKISIELGISSSTVGTHIENMKMKFNFDDVNSLNHYAIKCEEEKSQKKLFTTGE